MKRENPPAAARWILEHLVPGKKNDALAGDLLEEFGSGRSTLWYWRQVLSAFVVGSAKEARAHGSVLVLSVLLTIPIPALDIFVLRRIEMTRFFAQRWDLPWPYSTMADLGLTAGWNILYTWSGLLFCFLVVSVATRSINLRRLARGLWISAVVYVATFAFVMACVALFPFHGALIDIRRLTPFTSMALWLLTLRVPVFLSLVIALLSAFKQESRTKSSPANV